MPLVVILQYNIWNAFPHTVRKKPDKSHPIFLCLNMTLKHNYALYGEAYLGYARKTLHVENRWFMLHVLNWLHVQLDDGLRKLMAKTTNVWMADSTLLTYGGGSRSRRSGIFAGVTDIQGMDMYVNKPCTTILPVLSVNYSWNFYAHSVFLMIHVSM